jgi:hypothetical protein
MEDAMGLLDNGTLFKSAGVGLGVVLFAPAIVKVVGEVAKPLVKTMIKGGIMLYDRSRVLAAETMETLDDITAEAKAEMHSEREAQGAHVVEGKPKSRVAKKPQEAAGQGAQ